jgi:hypothetical protein
VYIVVLITEAAPVARILNQIGEPAEPPRISQARPGAAQSCSAWVPAQTIPGLGGRCSIAAHPPAWDDPPVEAVPAWAALAQPQPEYVFDQRVQW